MPRRPLAPIQLNKPLPPPRPAPSIMIHPTNTLCHPVRMHTTTSPNQQLRLPDPDSPIPTISIDTSLLCDGDEDGAHACGTQASSWTQAQLEAPTQKQVSRTRSQKSKSNHLQVKSSSLSPARPLVSPASSASGYSAQASSQVHIRPSVHPKVSTGGLMPITHAHSTTLTNTDTSTSMDPRTHTRATTASLISLLDFLEAEETEMRGEVQRVLRRMREVKRAVRAVKRERGLMKLEHDAAEVGTGTGATCMSGNGRERFADSEGEVSVGSAY